jgi:hypothetical protein
LLNAKLASEIGRVNEPLAEHNYLKDIYGFHQGGCFINEDLRLIYTSNKKVQIWKEATIANRSKRLSDLKQI